MNDIRNEDSWKKVWREDAYTAVNKMKEAGMDPTHSFDAKAHTFDEQSFNEEGKRRSKRIMNWIEGQGVRFEEATILDIGAASGVFSIPMAERGARVTSVEPCLPLAELLVKNKQRLTRGSVELVTDPFEEIDVQAKGWNHAFDLVFVSMCPVIKDWESVEKVLSCARSYCYISLMAGSRENSLVNEVWPLVTDKPHSWEHMEMGYLQHLLFLKGYSYGLIVSREMKTTEMTRATALREVMTWLGIHGLPVNDRNQEVIAAYLEKTYPTGKVIVREGGRYGKVLVRLQDQTMYTREI